MFMAALQRHTITDMVMQHSLPLHELDIPPPEKTPFAAGSFDSIGPLSRADFPHRHTFYEIVHVTGGAGTHVVDLTERPLRPPQLCFILPGQVHFWHRAAALDGKVLLFTDEFLAAHPGDRDALADLAARRWNRLSTQDSAAVAALIEQMEQECARREPGREAVLQAYLHILIVRAGRLGRAGPAPAPLGRPAAVAQEFNRLLAASGGRDHSVPEFARRVGVSPTYLNESVKSVTGRTPGQLIRQAKVLEAKRLLARTSLAVVQISRELGFADPAYFCRFFRRETGMTPGAFRGEHR